MFDKLDGIAILLFSILCCMVSSGSGVIAWIIGVIGLLIVLSKKTK